MIDILCTIDTMFGTLRHGRLHRFSVAGGGTSARMCEKTLREFGVPVYGRSPLPDNGRAFMVPLAQAEYAEYLIASAGVLLTCKLLNPKNASYTAPKTSWGVSAKSGIVGKIAKLLGV
jgi:hypothetical protein